jgi:uncharacterized protein (TIGR02679 family)
VTDPSRVRALLGAPRLAPLFEAVRRRLEETGGAARTVTLPDASAGTRAAVADLMGWSAVPAGGVRVELARLDSALRESALALDLRTAVELLSGPLRNLKEERRERHVERERLWAEARAAIAAAGRSELDPWLDHLQGGALARAARASGRPEQAMLSDALRVALRLPAGGKLLAVFSSELLGDPHALDHGGALAPLALRAAAAVAGWPAVPPGAAGRRQLWAAVGVDCDPLSASVLVLGVRPGGTGLLARQLRESADAGEPRRITLRELERSDVVFETGGVLYVCENPAVVAAAADALGARSAALACSEGVPTTAVMQVLRAAATRGVRLRIRADFDWPGLRIAAQLMAAGSSEPWRFSARDYEAAVADGHTGPLLGGPRTSAPWDRDLAARMADAGVSVPEERLLDALLSDLRTPSRQAGAAGAEAAGAEAAGAEAAGAEAAGAEAAGAASERWDLLRELRTRG